MAVAYAGARWACMEHAVADAHAQRCPPHRCRVSRSGPGRRARPRPTTAPGGRGAAANPGAARHPAWGPVALGRPRGRATAYGEDSGPSGRPEGPCRRSWSAPGRSAGGTGPRGPGGTRRHRAREAPEGSEGAVKRVPPKGCAEGVRWGCGVVGSGARSGGASNRCARRAHWGRDHTFRSVLTVCLVHMPTD